ncbi:MAG: hypothetical protein HY904_22555 [Deltaproteobacteria bacterium]|nr:hypothetical protein [Deltaproteobacteria bacterium]
MVVLPASGHAAGSAARLEELAAVADALVLADDAAALVAGVPPLLNWAGLAFPTWAPMALGVLRGRAGAWDALSKAAWRDAGVAPGTRVAVLRARGQEAPLVAVEGVDLAACQRLAAAVRGGPAGGAEAWRRRGICVVAVGDCAAAPCGVGLDGAARAADRGARALAALPGGGVRAWLAGAALRAFAGPRAARSLEEVGGVVGRLDVSQRPWRVDGELLHAAAAWPWEALQPLPAAGLLREEDPALEVVVAPAPAQARAALRGRPGTMAGGLARAAQDGLLEGPVTWTWSWRGLDASVPGSVGWRGTLRYGLEVHTAFPSAQGARDWSQRLHREWEQDGAVLTDGVYAWGDRGLESTQQERRVSVRAVGRSSSAVRVEEAPRQWPGAHLQVRLDGRRVLRNLRRVPLLAAADQEDLAWAPVVTELLGPMLERLELLDAGLAPSSRGTRFAATVALAGLR